MHKLKFEIKLIKEIADELSYNYFRASFGTSDTNSKINEIEAFPEKRDLLVSEIFEEKSLSAILDNEDRENAKYRNVLLVGAGASYNAYKQIPLGDQLKQYIKTDFGIGDIPAINENFEKDLEDSFRIRSGSVEKSPDFETFLHVISKYVGEEQLRKVIVKYSEYKYCSSLFYEFVSHLFKHLFLDVIINFNFDELLDHSIKQEVGEDNYRFILSDGDCEEPDQSMVEGRIKKPIYIKPHGTISHSSSLRFTKEQYVNVPERIKTFLKDILSGYNGGDPKDYIQNLNIICVGFKMESIEFNKILEECLSSLVKLNFYYIGNDDLFEIKINDPDKKITTKVFNLKKFENDNEDFLKDNKHLNTLDLVFREIWVEIRKNFKEKFRPRGVARHALSHYLFYNQKFNKTHAYYKDLAYNGREGLEKHMKNIEILKKYYSSTSFFLDKILFELSLAFIRNNGMVDVKNLLSGRIQVYYKELQKGYAVNVNVNKFHLFDLVESFILKDYQRLVSTWKTGDFMNFMSEKEYFIELIYSKFLTGSFLNSLNKKLDHVKKRLKENFVEEILINCLAHYIRYHTDEESLVILKRFSEYAQKANITKENIDDLLNKVKKINHEIKFSTNIRARLSTVMFTHFITNEHLSSQFLFDFFNKSFCDIPLNEPEEGLINEPVRFIPGVFNLYRRINSDKISYCDISPNFNDHSLMTFKSYDKSKIVHTLLCFEFEFYYLMKYKQWDYVLLISENATRLRNYLNYIQTQPPLNGKNKSVYLICSQQAIEKTYPNANNDSLQSLSEFKQEIIGLSNHTNVNIFVFTLPYWKHNRHMLVTIKNIKNGVYDYPGSLYYYKRGLGRRINPIVIKHYKDDKNEIQVKFDQELLVETFFRNLNRAIEYNIKLKDVKSTYSAEEEINHFFADSDGSVDYLQGIIKISKKYIEQLKS